MLRRGFNERPSPWAGPDQDIQEAGGTGDALPGGEPGSGLALLRRLMFLCWGQPSSLGGQGRTTKDNFGDEASTIFLQDSALSS